MKLEPVETPEEWSDRFLNQMPVGSISNAIANAMVEYRKVAVLTESIIRAITGTPVKPDVAIRESSFMYSLVMNGGTILDVITMVEVGLLSRDAISTYTALKKTMEAENGI